VQEYNLQPDGTTPSFIHLDEINTMSILDAALDYCRRGFIVTPLHEKRPILECWQERNLGAADLPRNFRDGRNIGIVLGGPVGIVDVDLDNPLAIAASDLLLPKTVQSGRLRRLWSHYWYLCDPVPTTRKYTLPKVMAARLKVEPGEAMLAELRSTGHQTVVAPSIHPVDGDRYLWHPGEICEIEGVVLAGLVLDVAVAALLALNRPLGSRKWFLIHAFGFLCLRLGPERAEKIVEAASAHFDDEEHDERMLAVRSFLRKPVDDDAPMMEGLLAAELERLAPGVPNLICRWCARDRREGGGRGEPGRRHHPLRQGGRQALPLTRRNRLRRRRGRRPPRDPRH